MYRFEFVFLLVLWKLSSLSIFFYSFYEAGSWRWECIKTSADLRLFRWLTNRSIEIQIRLDRGTLQRRRLRRVEHNVNRSHFYDTIFYYLLFHWHEVVFFSTFALGRNSSSKITAMCTYMGTIWNGYICVVCTHAD